MLLDTNIPSSYNNLCAEVAQSVEQRTENPRVPSSILGLGTKTGGSSSAVECLLAKEEVASSNLVFRSIWIISRSGGIGRRDSLKNCWRATSMSVRARPSALYGMPSCVVVAQGTLNPPAQVRILARQPEKVISLPQISFRLFTSFLKPPIFKTIDW